MINRTAMLRRIVYVIVFLHNVNHLCFCFSIVGSRFRPIEMRSAAGDDDGWRKTIPSLHRSTTYSWINPKLQTKEHANKRGNHTASSDSQGEYKRIQLDGCGSILVHSGSSSRVTSLQHTGLSLWSAAYVMSYYIDDMWNQDMRNNEATKKWIVLDLGAGLGLCSAVAAKHGMNVISTDSDSQALILLDENLRRNCNDDSGCISVHFLDWIAAADQQADIATNPVFEKLEMYGGPDLVILSDVIYSATKPAWKALIVLLQKLRSQRMRLQCSNTASVDRIRCDSTNTPAGDPYVLLSYTQRRRDMSPQDEAAFFADLRNAGMEAVMVPPSHIPNGETYMLTTLLELRWAN